MQIGSSLKDNLTYLFRLLLALLLGNALLLCGNSCSSSSSPKTTMVDAEADSLASSTTEVDSLLALTDYYASVENEYGEMVARQSLGEHYYRVSNYLDAIGQQNRVLALAENLDDTARVVQTLNRLGNCLHNLGVTGQSAEYHFRALGLCEEWTDKTSFSAKKQRVESLKGIGGAQLTLGNYIRAEHAYRLALATEIKEDHLEGQAEIYANLGQIKELIGQKDSAFIYYERSLEMNRGANSKIGISLCYGHFGRLAEASGDLDAALRYYYRSYFIMKDEPLRPSIMESGLAMARIYLKRGQMQEAHESIESGWKAAQRVGSFEMMSEVCLLKSQYAELKGDTQSALNWYKRSNSYRDSVTNEHTRVFVQKVRQQYVSDRNNAEIERLRMNYSRVKKDNRDFVVWAVFAGLFALMCIGFLLYILRVRMRSQAMLRHMEKVRTDFFTNITHEFRTPLTVMLGLGKQISEWKGTVEEKDCHRIGSMIVRQGNSLLDLVNQLLDIAKAESAIGRADWRTGDVVPYVSMVVENCQEFAKMKNVSMAYIASERELEMDFVPDYLRKVLQNLLTNAIKYSGEGGKVTVQMQRIHSQMQLLVSDTGRGIPEEDIPHLFDAFYTATNLGIEVSTGVGLAMVRQMVLAMKGKVEVESTLGKGTRFTITLPLKQGEKRFAAFEKSRIDGPREYLPAQHVEKGDMPVDELTDAVRSSVLIIEDNRDVATYMGMQLSGRFRVAYASNGKDGLERANELTPDLIITDLMMPVMDGYEVCRQLRQSETLNHVPIIIVSAKSTESDRLRGLEAGADAYLYKPFNADELQMMVSNLIEQRKSLRLRFSMNTQHGDLPTPGLKPFEREFLNKFVDVVYNQMPKGNIDAESLASMMCMSSSQLRRRIFAITGEKLTTFVLQIRLKHARQLLDTQGDMPVADVASRCGFDDAAYFSRTFKNVYRMTPSQYRRQGNIARTD